MCMHMCKRPRCLNQRGNEHSLVSWYERCAVNFFSSYDNGIVAIAFFFFFQVFIFVSGYFPENLGPRSLRNVRTLEGRCRGRPQKQKSIWGRFCRALGRLCTWQRFPLKYESKGWLGRAIRAVTGLPAGPQSMAGKGKTLKQQKMWVWGGLLPESWIMGFLNPSTFPLLFFSFFLLMYIIYLAYFFSVNKSSISKRSASFRCIF